jgi:hypothetical protein
MRVAGSVRQVAHSVKSGSKDAIYLVCHGSVVLELTSNRIPDVGSLAHQLA